MYQEWQGPSAIYAYGTIAKHQISMESCKMIIFLLRNATMDFNYAFKRDAPWL